MKKYNFGLNDKCIWVSPDKKEIIDHYGADPGDVVTVTTEEGFIVPESDDGDNGFIFILRNKIREAGMQLKKLKLK